MQIDNPGWMELKRDSQTNQSPIVLNFLKRLIIITCVTFYFVAKIVWFQDPYKFFHAYVPFVLFFLFIYSIILIDKLSHYFKKKDPKEIVIDEFFGQSIPLFFYFLIAKFQWITKRGQVDYDSFLENPELWILLSFILFRIFDIFKPYPINIIDKKVKNGLGVMLDDIIAGIYATIIVIILFILWF